MANTTRRNADAPFSGGATDGSAEGPVMGLERSAGVADRPSQTMPGLRCGEVLRALGGLRRSGRLRVLVAERRLCGIYEVRKTDIVLAAQSTRVWHTIRDS